MRADRLKHLSDIEIEPVGARVGNIRNIDGIRTGKPDPVDPLQPLVARPPDDRLPAGIACATLQVTHPIPGDLGQGAERCDLRGEVCSRPDDDHRRVPGDGVVCSGGDRRDAGLSGKQPEVDLDPVLLEPVKDFAGGATARDGEATAEVALLVGNAECVPLDHFKEGGEDRLLRNVSRRKPVCVAPEERYGHAERVVGVEDGVTRDVDLLIVQNIPRGHPVDHLPLLVLPRKDQVFGVYRPPRTDLLVGRILHPVSPVLCGVPLDRPHHSRDPGVERVLPRPGVGTRPAPGRSRTNRRNNGDLKTVERGRIDDLGNADLPHHRLHGGAGLSGRPGTVHSVKVQLLYRVNRDWHFRSLEVIP